MRNVRYGRSTLRVDFEEVTTTVVETKAALLGMRCDGATPAAFWQSARVSFLLMFSFRDDSL